MHDLDPNNLLLFARIVDAASFTRAAERLHMPKSTLSRRLSHMEEVLGERLITRTTRSLRLTELGAAVLEHARQIDSETEAALALARQRQLEPAGTLRISMPNDLATQLISPVLAEYSRRYPQVQLQLDLSPRRVDLIGEGFDLAIRMGSKPVETSLVARRIWLYTPQLYAAPSYISMEGEPHTPDDLLNHACLCLTPGGGDEPRWLLQRGNEQHEIAPASRFGVNSPDMLARLAAQALGITAVAHLYAETFVRQGELVRVLPDWHLPAVTAWAVFPERRLMPLKTRAFLDLLEASLHFAH